MDVFQVAEYKEYLFDTVKKIFGIDSPSGYYPVSYTHLCV